MCIDLAGRPWARRISFAEKRQIIHARREAEALVAAGYRKHETDWEIHRGAAVGQVIVDAKVSADGLYVWTKLGTRPPMTPNTSEGELLTHRVDFDRNGLDDLAIGGDLISMLRLERMSGNSFWGAVYMRDGRSLRLSFNIEKRSLRVTAEWERGPTAKHPLDFKTSEGDEG